MNMSVNFNQANDGITLLKYSFEVTVKAYPKTIPLMLSIFGLLCLIHHVPEWTPKAYQEDAQLGIMFVYIAILPILSLLFYITDLTAQKTTAPFTTLLMHPVQRMLGLFGCLISMSLVPLIIIAAHFISFILYLEYKIDTRIIFLSQLFFYALIFLTLLSKIYAPIIAVTNKIETNTALDTSIAASKGYFARNLIYVGLGLTILLAVLSIPNLIAFYFPSAHADLPEWVPQTISYMLLLFVFPWIAALLICHKIDLLYRFEHKTQQEEKTKRENFAYAHKIKKAGTEANPTAHQSSVSESNNKDDDLGF